jgi:hypothetical protein
MRYLAAVAVAGLVAGCGGGGGSTSSGGSSGGGTTTPTVVLTLVNSADVALTTNAISKGGVFYAKAVVANANGTPLANQLVTFTTDYTVATLSGNTADATALTDASGVAKVLVSPLSLSTVGAAALTASATVSDTGVTATLNFSTLASNVTLANMALSPSTIGALETSAVTVQGLIDGNLATGSNVTVNFSASCGAFSPASVTTNSTGIASSTYQSAATCSGPVTLTSSAAGATSLSTTLTVTPARAANIVFTSATPTLLYVSSAASGSKTSVVRFQVLDSNAGAMASQAVSMSLSNAAISAGVAFSLSGTTSTTPQTVTTDSGGFASIAVVSGTLPTPLTVNAVLVSDATIRAASLGLSVTNGAPTQNAASFNAEKHSLEALNIVGLTTPMIFRVADRQGNPVPDGTAVTFVASTGLITGSCTLTNSACTVTYTSQGTAPANGRAVILAYLDGEESFTDLNGDNVWQSPEPFFDVGMTYLDLDGSGVYTVGEQTFPGGSTGSAICSTTAENYPSILNTCDGVWSANIRVRKQDVITWATSQAVIKLTQARSNNSFQVLVHDNSSAAAPFNAMPSGTTVGAAVTTTGSTCAVSSVNPGTVNNSANSGTYHTVILNGDANCVSLGRTEVVRTQITAGTVPSSPGTITVTRTVTEVGGSPVTTISSTTATTDTNASDNTVTNVLPATAITVTVTSPSGYVTSRVFTSTTPID